MAGKKKDIWEKISETAAATGKSIGDEYQKLKLNHDIWLLDRDLQKAYSRVGRIIYDRRQAGNLEADSELGRIFDDIAQLKDGIKKQMERRDNIGASRDQSAETSPPRDSGSESAKAPETDTTGHTAEMEFLDDTATIFSCPACGATFNIDSGMVPNFCMHCGSSFGQD